ncbi:MAG TPA: ZIP family metal transporter [Gemmatimonadales bacterium]|nr:ZIP family metal transporter [Gemmatimonadales bacterium]
MSLAVGALLANGCFELIPESIERLGPRPEVFGYLLAGFGGFALIERLIHFHLHRSVPTGYVTIQPFVALNLIGVTLHNAIDGMIIAASFAAGTGLGVATTIAVVLHEIPHEIGNFGVFVHGGVSPPRAVLLNLVSALAAVLGAITTLAVGLRSSSVIAALLPVAAGSLVYVATIDLIPELVRQIPRPERWQAMAFMLIGGAVTMFPVLLER